MKIFWPRQERFPRRELSPAPHRPGGGGPSPRPHTPPPGPEGGKRSRHLRAGAAEGSPPCPLRAPAQLIDKLRGKGHLPPPLPLPLTGRDSGLRKRWRLQRPPHPSAPSSPALSRALLPLITSAEGPSVPGLLPSPRHGVPPRPPATHPVCGAAGEGRRGERTQRKGASGCSRAPETSWQGPPSRTAGGGGEGHSAPGCPPLPQERGRAASGWWRYRRQPALPSSPLLSAPVLPFPSLPPARPGRTGRQRREAERGPRRPLAGGSGRGGAPLPRASPPAPASRRPAAALPALSSTAAPGAPAAPLVALG